MDTVNEQQQQAADHKLGMTLAARILGVFAFCASLALAWACSSIWMGVLVFIIAYIIAIIAGILATLAFTLVTPVACETLGRGARVASDKVSSVYTSLRARFA